MKNKIGTLLLVTCLMLTIAVNVQAATNNKMELISKVKIVIYDEYGGTIKGGEENSKLISQLVEVITGEELECQQINDVDCTHIPCNQYEGYLYAHAKVSASECWVYRMRAIICNCCGSPVQQLSGWEFQYSHPAH